jgi:hypothetical protein
MEFLKSTNANQRGIIAILCAAALIVIAQFNLAQYASSPAESCNCAQTTSIQGEPALLQLANNRIIVLNDTQDDEVLPVVTVSQEEEQVVVPKLNAFTEHMVNFSMESLIEGVEQGDREKLFKGTQKFIQHLFNFHIRPPKVPLNESCKPKELAKVPDCSAYPGVFSGPRNKTAKLGLAVQMAFEIDALEIALHQYEGLVDKFFILESVTTHLNIVKKPLLWEAVRATPRFERFGDFVVHLVLNDAHMAKGAHEEGGNIWAIETYQERQRWRDVKLWNDYTNFFGDEDVVGFGDIDEIPSRENLHLLKHCELAVDQVDIGLWMTQGRLTDAYPGFAVPGYYYTYGDPTFYRYAFAVSLGAADGQRPFVTRRRGESGNFLLGGMHMTFDGLLTSRLLKLSSCTECENELHRLRHWSEMWSTNRTLELEQELLKVPEAWQGEMIPVTQIDPRIPSVPWLLECNPERFPVWRGKHDTRLD